MALSSLLSMLISVQFIFLLQRGLFAVLLLRPELLLLQQLDEMVLDDE